MEDQKQSTEVQSTEQTPEFHLTARVAAYPLVSQLLATGKEYYNWGKEKSSVVAYAESTLESGLNYLAPKVEEVLESETYKSYARPVLVKADNLANSALDSVEPRVSKIIGNLENTRDSYKLAVQKISDLTLRASPYEQTLDLIKYAQTSLDSGLTTLNQIVHKEVEHAKVLVKETPKEVREKINNTTHEAIAALHKAVEVVSKQLPGGLTAQIEKVKEELVKREGEIDYSLFKTVATNSSKLLHDIGDTVGQYVSKGEALPHQLATTTYTGLHKVLENLITLLEHYKPEEVEDKKEEKKE